MLYWSRYNRIFHNPTFGYFLYNSLSNAFIELDKCHFQLLETLHNNPDITKVDIDRQFLQMIRTKLVLVEKNEDNTFLMERHYKRYQTCFDNTHLFLTICPTLGCNFSCPYCYEHSQGSTRIMDSKTIDQVVKFIKRFSYTKHLSVSWYGGEPTLAFDVICDISRKIKNIDIIYNDASLITNGYLLDKCMIEKLNDLNIKSIQTTIDGFEETHNSRRMLKGGFPTFQKIINNIEDLMNSSFSGSCNIRVNIDKKNATEYAKLYTHLQNRFVDKKVSIYAGHVESSGDNEYDTKCALCSTEWANFTLELYREHFISVEGKIYPSGNVHKICSANTHNSFVIGPDGELYKCWQDVGKAEMVVGSIFEEDYITNSKLVALYNLGTDPYLDSECRDCFYLPICGGGCANMRLRSKFLHENGLKFCSLYKDHLDQYLMEYYSEFISNDLCKNFLNIDHETMINGYRNIQPDIDIDKITLSTKV